MPTSVSPASLWDAPRRTLPPDLADAETAARLSPASVVAVDAAVRAWGLTTDQACALMGGINPSTYARRLKDPERVRLGVDELTRASYLIGIYRALHTLYSGDLPSAWMTIPNANPLFGGATPFDYAVRQGILGLADIRALLDGYRGGV